MNAETKQLDLSQYRAIQPELEAYHAARRAHVEAQDRLARMVRLIEPDEAWIFNADECVFTKRNEAPAPAGAVTAPLPPGVVSTPPKEGADE